MLDSIYSSMIDKPVFWPVAGPQKLNIEEGLVQAIQALNENPSSAVFLNSQLENFLKKTVGVRQGCLLSPILFNLSLQKITNETPHDHHTSVSIGGRPICNL